jgi:competence protein ComEA
VPRRLVLAAALAVVLLAPSLRRRAEVPPPPRPCREEGRGAPPRHWLGCAADAGPARALQGDERLLLGLPLDPNVAGARELAFVPGLSRSLAAAVVSDREARGPFLRVEDLLRVRGIGPKRLARARGHLAVAPAP